MLTDQMLERTPSRALFSTGIKTLSATVAALALFGAAPALADTVTLTMDEEVTQPLDGFSITKGGLTFTFADPSGGLAYGSIGPGNTTYISDPSIQGNITPFSVTFSKPVTSISFGLAELWDSQLFNASVELSNGSTVFFDLPVVDPFPEGFFSWTGPAVTGFTLHPVEGGPIAIAFDNLSVTFDAAVPETGTWLMMIAGFAAVGTAMRRQVRRPSFLPAA